MGANPVQVEVGEFDEGAEEVEEEVVAESSPFFFVLLHQAFALCHPGLGCGPSLCEGSFSRKLGGVLPREGL